MKKEAGARLCWGAVVLWPCPGPVDRGVLAQGVTDALARRLPDALDVRPRLSLRIDVEVVISGRFDEHRPAERRVQRRNQVMS